jgi:tetratricopeptide (TPR) repeat protein
MAWFQKRQLAWAAAALWLAATPGLGQPAEEGATLDEGAKLEELFAELAQPGRDDWERIEGEISRIWSHSGSPAMDLLLQRGEQALEAEDYPAAAGHFSALIDHAPDFAEGWNGRATAYFMMGEYSLSIADVEHVLALNPRHFGALAGLASMFEALGEPELALKALHAVQKLNPNRPNINDAAARLEQMTGEAEL